MLKSKVQLEDDILISMVSSVFCLIYLFVCLFFNSSFKAQFEFQFFNLKQRVIIHIVLPSSLSRFV